MTNFLSEHDKSELWRIARLLFGMTLVVIILFVEGSYPSINAENKEELVMERDIVSYDLKVTVVDCPDHAPTYNKDTEVLKFEEAIVVGRRTQAGNPTVDIQLRDHAGKKYLVMTTGALMEALGAVCRAKNDDDAASGEGSDRRSH